MDRHVAGGLPPVTVDRLRIAEVFTNLLSNALRHTPRGGSITVDASADGPAVVFSVSDTGSGIPADQVSTVFDRFAKAPGSRGVGLGLAIAKSLVVVHGGQIGVESVAGQGTRVRFTVPSDPG
jgi:signal transduction histidine kinase